MEYLITDSLKEYNKADGSGQKFLFSNKILAQSGYLDKNGIQKVNLELIFAEYLAADRMLEDLKSSVRNFGTDNFPVNKFLATRSRNSRVYALLYINLWAFGIWKHIFFIFLEGLLKHSPEIGSGKISLSLSPKFYLIQHEISGRFPGPDFEIKFRWNSVDDSITKLKNKIKNVFYGLSDFVDTTPPKAVPPGKKHLLLLVSDTPSGISVLDNFWKIISDNKDKIHVSIVQVTSGLPASHLVNLKELKSENISYYPVTRFRNSSDTDLSLFYDLAERVNDDYSIFRYFDILGNTEMYYSWIGNAFEKLSPDVSMTTGVGVISRVFSDVSRFYEVPSVNLEYGLFTDDSIWMEGDVKFDYRACISEATAGIWKRRNDPSGHQIALGYCKLDEIDRSKFPSKTEFNSKYGLSDKRKTVLFASTWALAENESINLEKENILRVLCELCHANEWNLFIKKHPTELDLVANEIIREYGYPFQVCCEHKSADLYESIHNSDVVLFQSSTVALEALYFGKPFCFVSIGVSLDPKKYSVFENEDIVASVNNPEDLEKYLRRILLEDGKVSFDNELSGLRKKFLYSNDGKATERLFNLLMKI